MRRSVIAPLIGTIVLVGGLGAAGWAVYQAGYRSGLAENASQVIVNQPGFGGFGLFLALIFLFFLFSFVGKMFFWRRWRGGHHGRKGWDAGEGSPMESRLHEWHERQHTTERRYRSDEPESS